MPIREYARKRLRIQKTRPRAQSAIQINIRAVSPNEQRVVSASDRAHSLTRSAAVLIHCDVRPVMWTFVREILAQSHISRAKADKRHQEQNKHRNPPADAHQSKSSRRRKSNWRE